jgi:hypothetical protein
MTLRRIFVTMMGLALMVTGCGRVAVPEDADADVDFGNTAAPRSRGGQKVTPAERPASRRSAKPAEAAATPEADQPDRPQEGESKPESADAEPAADSRESTASGTSSRVPTPPSGSGEDRRAPQTPREQTEPVFPGRESRGRPATPAAAAAEGRRALQAAAAARRRGDQRAACRLALDACTAVAAHAEKDADCRRVAAEAEQVIERCGGRPAGGAVPTRFE